MTGTVLIGLFLLAVSVGTGLLFGVQPEPPGEVTTDGGFP